MSSSLQILSSMRRGGGGERNLKDSDSDLGATRPGDIELGGAVTGGGPSGSLHGGKAGAGSTRPRASASVKQQQQQQREMRPLLSSSINAAPSTSSSSASGRNPIMSAIGIAPPQGFRDTGDHIGYVGGGHDRRDVSGKKFRVQVPKKFIFWFLVVFLALPIFLFTYILWTRIFKGKAAGAGHYHHNAPAIVHQQGGVRGGVDPSLLPGDGSSGDSDANEPDLKSIEFPAEQDSAEKSNQSQRDGTEPPPAGAEVVAEDDPQSVPNAAEPPGKTKDDKDSAGSTSEIVDAASMEMEGEGGAGDATEAGDGQKQDSPGDPSASGVAVDAPPQQAEEEGQSPVAGEDTKGEGAEDTTTAEKETTGEPNVDAREKHTDQDEDGGAKVDGKEHTAADAVKGDQEGDTIGGGGDADGGGDDEKNVVDGQ